MESRNIIRKSISMFGMNILFFNECFSRSLSWQVVHNLEIMGDEEEVEQVIKECKDKRTRSAINS